jgi:hypothetical protein
MSSAISSIPAAPVTQAPRPAAGDSDGDNDGSKAAATNHVAPQPQVVKPTATLGNNVNTVA